MKEHDRCGYCGRRSERISLGLSCFHCGRKYEPIRLETLYAIILAFGLVALGAWIARWLA